MNWSDFFSYEPTTGRLLWSVKRPGPKTAIGQEAGSIKHDGRYRSVVLHHKRYYVHRIVWELCNGPIRPGMCIDHVDGNGLNNRPANLRIATLSDNQRNAKLPRNNKTGIQGIYQKKNGYEVRCSTEYVGFYGDFFEACCARKSAEKRSSYHENHGRIRA